MDWVWMQNESGTSADTSNGDFAGAPNGPDYLYTARMRESTSRHGGWSRSGMLKYNELYSKVKEDRLRDNGAFSQDYYNEHRIEKSKLR
jgi:hypothetical protein